MAIDDSGVFDGLVWVRGIELAEAFFVPSSGSEEDMGYRWTDLE